MFICRNFLLLAKTNVGGILEDIKIAKAFKIVLRVKCVANNYRKKIHLYCIFLTHEFSFTMASHRMSICCLGLYHFLHFVFHALMRIAGFAIEFVFVLFYTQQVQKRKKFVDCFKLWSSIFLNGVLCLVSIALYTFMSCQNTHLDKILKKSNYEKSTKSTIFGNILFPIQVSSGTLYLKTFLRNHKIS